MSKTIPLLLLAIMPLPCCSAADEVETPAPSIYDGPPLRLSRDGNKVVATMEVGSGGHALVLHRVQQATDHSRVELRFSYPGEGAMVTAALETLRVTADLADANRSVRVYVQKKEVGAHYIVEPEFALAGVLEKQ